MSRAQPWQDAVYLRDVPPPPEHVLRAARRTVAAHARDTADLADLLAALGLDEEEAAA
jgi:hypothetical protein